MRIIKIKESEIKAMVARILEENEMEQSNYMFFSNLEQIERQCKLLRQVDPSKINELLDNGHDWADDHVSEAKTNMDQVFDFIMNETKGAHDDKPVNADMNQFSLNETGSLEENCWDGYKQVGSKMKNGKKVPNCVPVNEASSRAQQAAIAINMKKEVKKPKNESYGEIDESKNCPTDPGKWAASKAAAKAKFDVYPSAYANGWAAKNYKSKGGGWRKCK
jgi:hypothetical protein